MRRTLPPVRAQVPLLALALLLAAALVRGCIALRADWTAPAPDAPGTQLLLYDARNEKVLTLPLEEYLFGVVASEMPASFSPEALKAQAVSARTYAARHLRAYGGKACGAHGADMCSDSTCCQAWRSRADHMARWGDNADFYAHKIDEAVRETAGVVALYAGRPIDALYHSTSGGATENASDVFGADVPYLVSVASPGEESAAHYEDTFTFTPKAFAKAINKKHPEAKLKAGELSEQVKILSRSAGGRVLEVRLGGATVTGRAFRAALDLPSAAFTISFTKDTVRIDTRGYGHGVGMSQYGANAMAREGASYQEILLHYYTGITLGTLDEIARG